MQKCVVFMVMNSVELDREYIAIWILPISARFQELSDFCPEMPSLSSPFSSAASKIFLIVSSFQFAISSTKQKIKKSHFKVTVRFKFSYSSLNNFYKDLNENAKLNGLVWFGLVIW